MANKTNKTAAATSVVTAAAKRSQTGPFVAPPGGKITIVVAAPKAAATKGGQRYALYRNGQTVQQYLDASVKAGNRLALAKADVMWDFNHQYITIAGLELQPLGAPAKGRSAAAATPASAAAATPAKAKAATPAKAKATTNGQHFGVGKAAKPKAKAATPAAATPAPAA